MILTNYFKFCQSHQRKCIDCYQNGIKGTTITQTFKEAIIGNKNMYAELDASYMLAPEGF